MSDDGPMISVLPAPGREPGRGGPLSRLLRIDLCELGPLRYVVCAPGGGKEAAYGGGTFLSTSPSTFTFTFALTLTFTLTLTI